MFWRRAWEWISSWWNGRTDKTDKTVETPPALVAPEPLPSGPPELSKPSATLAYYEKERRKHDKFVKPLGEKPQPKPRLRTQEVKAKLPPKPPLEPPVEPEVGSFDGINIVDEHHEDHGLVLYKMDELHGEFNFRDTVLEQLDCYFAYLKRMQKRDRDAWHLYRQVGATLLPYISTGSWKRQVEKPMIPTPNPPLPPRFNELRPSFGCFVYGADPETEKYERLKHDNKKDMWVPKFLYYIKYKQPPSTIQAASGGDVYKLTVWWDRRDKKMKYGTPQDIPVFISKDGQTITALKVIETRYKTLGGYVRRWAGTGRKHKSHAPPSIPQRAWQFPKDYIQWAKDSGNDDVSHFLIGIFIDAITLDEASHMSMTRIAVSKGGMTAVFSVNIRRTAYFFQDRDISVTQGGTRKPIFHMVKPHIRSDGSVVKMHFRGLRDFTWAGYKVHISIPGLDHLDIHDLDLGSVDSEFGDKTDWDMKKLGAFLADEMRKGKGANR